MWAVPHLKLYGPNINIFTIVGYGINDCGISSVLRQVNRWKTYPHKVQLVFYKINNINNHLKNT